MSEWMGAISDHTTSCLFDLTEEGKEMNFFFITRGGWLGCSRSWKVGFDSCWFLVENTA
ncbi:hypothetical protein BDBG_17041 [Blastomyces gilchristii SLH14081]|uniref:Uncharacterized protein n=1 Tax=Blastomyces gilchristii (strain SLH14081) TaxID=559298 RepID=A0A179UK47_BLAGS|nr:uncharacterized protein BDBG_17041 [Blastomyces gilchristii SLH14081]OAT08436.1 hypothetical protein BDBG_17041 [Blastomyces gilchristii SLH14081]